MSGSVVSWAAGRRTGPGASGTRVAPIGGVHDAASLAGLILDHLDEGVVVIEPDGTVARVTRPILRMLGHDAALLVAGDIRELWRRFTGRWADGRAIEEDVGRMALARRRAIGPLLIHLRSSVGEELTCEVTGIPLFDARGVLDGAVVTLRDVTALARRTAALDRAYRELTELHARLLRQGRDRAIGEAATATALGMNNLLNALGLGLRMQFERPSPERLNALLRIVEEGGLLMARFQTLVVERPSPGAAQVDLVVRQAIELVRPDLLGAAIDRPMQLDIQLSPAPPARIEERALREAVCALLVHARDSAARDASVLVETSATDGGARIRIAFPRAQRSDDEGVASMVRAAVDGAGGRFELRASATSFEAVIELQGTAAHVPAQTRAPSVVTRVERVLVVDDEESNRSMLVELLSLHGFVAEGAATGAEAIERARTTRFDAALVDLALPDIGGWEVVRRLRAEKRDMRIALVTGWETSSARPPERDLVDEVFHKPVDIAALLRLLGEGDSGDEARGE